MNDRQWKRSLLSRCERAGQQGKTGALDVFDLFLLYKSETKTLRGNSSRMATLSNPTIKFEPPAWTQKGAGPGASWARPRTPKPAQERVAQIAPNPPGAAPAAKATGVDISILGARRQPAIWAGFENGLYLWIVVAIAFGFTAYGLVLAFDNQDQTKSLADRTVRSDALAAQVATLQERVDGLVKAQSRQDAAESDGRVAIQQVQQTLDASIARLNDRMKQDDEFSQSRNSALELQIDKLEAKEELRPALPAEFPPLGRSEVVEPPQLARSESDGFKTPPAKTTRTPLKSELVSPAALAALEGRNPDVVEATAATKDAAHEKPRRKHSRTPKSQPSAPAPSQSPVASQQSP